MKNKIRIAEQRYSEMENRKSAFMEKYAKTGDTLYRDLADNETENMNELIVAIMKAKRIAEELKFNWK